MERNENGLSSLLYRTRATSCFNSGSNIGNENGNRNGNENGSRNGNGNWNGNGSVGGVTDHEQNGMGGCGCESCGMRQLAMVYSPMQCWRMLHTPEEALSKGTLFEELYKPYEEEW